MASKEKAAREREKEKEKEGAVVPVPPGPVQEEEIIAKDEAMAWKFLSLEEVTILLELDIVGVQKALEEFLNLKHRLTSLKEAVILDYYISGFWWAKALEFTSVQLGGFLTLLNLLMENVDTKHMTLEQNIQELGYAMAGIGECNSVKSGGFEFFTVDQAKAIINYLKISLFQHYTLYQYLFHSPREELVIGDEASFNFNRAQITTNSTSTTYLESTEIKQFAAVYIIFGLKYNSAITKNVVELVKPADSPFPAPLEEGLPYDIYSKFIALVPEKEEETKEMDGDIHPEEEPKAESEVDPLVGYTIEDVQSVLGEITNEMIVNVQSEINEKLQIQEEAYSARIDKLKKM